MKKYLVVKDFSFMFDDPNDIEIVDQFDTAEEAENYINSNCAPNLAVWDGRFHRIYWIVKKVDEQNMNDIFNYEIEIETRRCKDCKYYIWYRDGKKYGCDRQPSDKIY